MSSKVKNAEFTTRGVTHGTARWVDADVQEVRPSLAYAQTGKKTPGVAGSVGKRTHQTAGSHVSKTKSTLTKKIKNGYDDDDPSRVTADGKGAWHSPLEAMTDADGYRYVDSGLIGKSSAGVVNKTGHSAEVGRSVSKSVGETVSYGDISAAADYGAGGYTGSSNTGSGISSLFGAVSKIPMPVMVWGGGLLVSTGMSVNANSSSSDTATTTTGGSTSATPTTQTQLPVKVAAGPFTAGVTITAYKPDGVTVLATGTIDSTGNVSLNLGSYTGAVLLSAVDSNGASTNYVDETTGKQTNLGSTVLRLAAMVNSGTNAAVTITPLTEIAVRQMGLSVGSNNLSNVSASTISSVNTSIAKLFLNNNSDVTRLEPKLTVDASGNRTASTADAYGKVLALLSGYGGTTPSGSQSANGFDATLTALNNTISTSNGVSSINNLTSFIGVMNQGLTTYNKSNTSSSLVATDKDIAPVLGVAAPTLALGTGVSDGATSLEATQASGVLTATAVSGTVLTATFTNSANVSVTKTVTSSGAAAPVVLSTADLTTLGDGTIKASVTASNSGLTGSATTTSFVLDTVSPTAVITTNKTSFASATDSAVLTFTFSEVPVGFDLTKVTVVGGTLTSPLAAATDSKIYISTFTPTLTGKETPSVSINAGGYQDAAGNLGSSAPSPAFTTTNSPTVTITSSASKLKTGETAIITFTFSAAPTGFDASKVTTTGGDLSNLSVSAGSTVIYTATFTPTQNSTTAPSITVAANSYTNSSGYGNAAGASPVIAVDTQPPTMSIASNITKINGISGSNVAVLTFTFSEAVTGFDVSKLSATTSGGASAGTFSNFSQNATNAKIYTATYTPSANINNATVSVTAAGSYTDAAGNIGSAQSLSLTVDNVAPVAPAVGLGTKVSTGANSATATQASGVVTVSTESGSSVNATFINNTKSVVKTITGAVAPQPVILQAADLSALGDGSITVRVAATDAAGNIGASASTSFVLDTVAPVAPTVAMGSGISNSVVGSTQAVQSSGVVTVNAEAGSTVLVTFSGNGKSVTKQLTANGSAQGVVLASGDLAGSTGLVDGLVTVSASATDAAGNISAVGSSSFTLKTQLPLAPVVALGTGVSNGANSAEATQSSGVVTVNAESSSSVQVTFSNGSKTVTKTLNGTGSAQAVPLNSADLTALGDGSITVTAKQTDATGSASPVSSTTFLLDATPPTAAISASQYLVTSGNTSTITFNFSEAVTGFNNNSVTVAGGTLSTITSGSNNTYTATFTADSSATVPAISINNNGYTDAVGNQGASAVLYGVTKDSNIPRVTITSDKMSLRSGDTATVTFTFSQAVSGFVLNDITLGNGTAQITNLAAVSGSTTTYTATYTPPTNFNGLTSVSVREASYTNAAGTVNGLAGSLSNLAINTIAPPSPVLALGAGVSDGATSTEAVQSGGVVTALGSSGATVTVTFANGSKTVTKTLTGNGAAQAVTLLAGDLSTLTDGQIAVTATTRDAAGNLSSVSNISFTLDTTPPGKPTMVVKAGQDANVNGSETGVDVEISSTGMVAGDKVQVSMGGQSFGSVYTVTSSDVTAGKVTMNLAKSALGADGVKAMTVVVTDAAGNVSTASDTLNITVGAVTPGKPTMVVKAGQDAYVNSSESGVDVEISFTGMTAGDKVQVSMGGQSFGSAYTVTSSDVTAGKVTMNLAKSALGTDGVKAMTVVVTNASGSSSTASDALNITVDTTAPGKPTMVVKAGQDAYVNGSETGVDVEISSTGMVAGDKVQVSMGGQSFGSAYTVTQADVTAGKVSMNLAKSALGADGVKAMTVVVTDAAGNASTASDALNITVDTTAPGKPTMVVKAGQDANVNGSETGVDVEISSTGMVAGDKVQVRMGGQSFGSVYTVTSSDVTAGKVTMNLAKSALGADGVKAMTVVVTDAAGNVSTASDTLNITVGTVTSGKPTMVVKTGQDAYVNSSESGVDVEISFTGMAAGDKVQVSMGGQSFGSAYTVTSSDVTAGKVTMNLAKSALGADGVKAMTVVVTNASGSSSTASDALNITVDTTAPGKPTMVVKTGQDAYVNSSETGVDVEISSTGMVAGDKVQVRMGGQSFGSVYTVTSSDVTAGKVTMNLAKSELGADGVKAMTVVVTDAAGNVSTASDALNITVDTTAPGKPTMVVKAGQDANVNGSETGVDVEISSTGMVAGDKVQVRMSGQSFGSVYTVTSSDVTAGKVTMNLAKSALGADGVKAMTVVVTDAAGNVSTVSDTLNITVGTAAPGKPTMVVKAGQDAYVNSSESGVDVEISFTGMTAGDKVQVSMDGQSFGSAYTVTSSDVTAGKVTMNLAKSALGTDGVKAMTVVVTNASGSSSTASDALNITVDTAAPSKPTMVVKAGQDAYVNSSETGVDVEISSTGMVAGDKVQVSMGGQSFGSAYTVTSSDVTAGKVTMNLAKSALGADGVKAMTVVVTDAAGNASTASDALNITVDTTAPGKPTMVVKAGQDANVNGSETGVDVEISSTGMVAGDKVQVRMGGQSFGSVYTVTSSDVTAGKVTMNLAKSALGADGVKAMTVVVTDAAGNVSTVSDTLNITVGTAAPGKPTMVVKAGQDAYVNSSESGVDVEISSTGMTAGDKVQVSMGGQSLGSAYTVTSSDVTAGKVTMNLAKSALGTDGVKAMTVVVTNASGSSSTASDALNITVDTTAPGKPTMVVKTGQDAYVNSSETGVDVEISSTGMVAGDKVQVRMGGQSFGSAYTVTSSDVTAGKVTMNLAKSDLGADGTKSMTVVVTDAAGNSSTASDALTLTVDQTSPTVTITSTSGTKPDLTASGSTSPLTFTFSEAVTGLDTSKFTAVGGTISALTAVSGSTTQYTATFTSSGFSSSASNTPQVDVAAGAFKDLAGNSNTATAKLSGGSGKFTAGPALGGMAITVYGEKGQVLDRSVLDADGRYKINTGAYSGKVLAVLTDLNGSAVNYMDEATLRGKDLGSVVLRAAGVVEAGKPFVLNVTPLTELAVRKMGLKAGQISLSQVDSGDIVKTNKAIAQLFLGEDQQITQIKADAVINKQGESTVANKYGQVLATLSEMDKINQGSMETTLSKLSHEITPDMLKHAAQPPAGQAPSPLQFCADHSPSALTKGAVPTQSKAEAVFDAAHLVSSLAGGLAAYHHAAPQKNVDVVRVASNFNPHDLLLANDEAGLGNALQYLATSMVQVGDGHEHQNKVILG